MTHRALRKPPHLGKLVGVIVLAALLLPACGADSTAGQIIVDFDPALGIDQLRVQVVHDGTTVVASDAPAKAGAPLLPGGDIVVLFDDALAGQGVTILVAGLKTGAQVAGGEVALTLRAHQTVVGRLRLTAAACDAGEHVCDAGCFPDDDPAHCGLACLACPAPTAHGTAVCRSATCSVQCSPGFSVCGDDCADLASDHDHCGQCGHACDAAEVCQGSQCRPNPCASGNHPCNGTCVSDLDPAHCGSSCTPCPEPADGTATCDGTTCGLDCGAGSHACGESCVSDTDVSHCGTSCTPCPAPKDGYSTCNGVSCGFGCLTGYHACGDACADNGSVDTCGASCTPCPVPEHGGATCTGGVCGITCDGGYVPCFATCVPDTTGCTATWTDRTSTPAPAACSRPAMAYDAGRGVTVLFGGYNNTAGLVYGDTWEWNGTAWRQVTPATSPTARSAAAMAYDPLRGNVVLFGGEDVGGIPVANTTWTFDGTTWTPYEVGGPVARSFAAMVWDDDDGIAVLFGGNTGTTSSVFTNDVWAWNGSSWEQRTLTGTAPQGRAGMSVAYDSRRHELVVFGGTSDPLFGAVLGDTWLSDLVTWSSTTATGPSAREGATFVYHPIHEVGVLYSGNPNTGTDPQDTWVWDGATWSALTPAGTLPPGRWRGAMAYDSGRNVIVLFGGATTTTYLQDTWELSW